MLIPLKAPYNGKVVRLLKKIGSSIKGKDKIIQAEIEDGNKKIYIENMTIFSGSLSKWEIGEGDSFTANETILAYIKPCEHHTLFNNMCASCGDNAELMQRQKQELISEYNAPVIETKSDDRSTLHVSGGHGVLKLSAEESSRIGTNRTNELKSNSKLALVLDIDHTLLHCVRNDIYESTNTPEQYQKDYFDAQLELSPTPVIVNELVAVSEQNAVESTQYRPNTTKSVQVTQTLLVKFRPYLRYFLTEMNKFYEISLYTNGTRSYAEAVAKILDPDNKLFNQRIVARTDSSSNSMKNGVFINDGSKSLDILFLNNYSLTVIIDDREDVWMKQKVGDDQTKYLDHLLLIEPYLFFKQGVEVYNRSASSQKQSINLIEPANSNKALTVLEDKDTALLRFVEFLKHIHSAVYVDEPRCANVVEAISLYRSKILQNVTISFSGVLATGKDLNTNRFYNLALALGAYVVLDFDLSAATRPITHLVCSGPGTSKYLQCVAYNKGVLAQCNGDRTLFHQQQIHIIHTDWLLSCKCSLSHVSEDRFSLVAGPEYHVREEKVHPESSAKRAKLNESSDDFDLWMDNLGDL